jgi:hypothetical protein
MELLRYLQLCRRREIIVVVVVVKVECWPFISHFSCDRGRSGQICFSFFFIVEIKFGKSKTIHNFDN